MRLRRRLGIPDSNIILMLPDGGMLSRRSSCSSSGGSVIQADSPGG